MNRALFLPEEIQDGVVRLPRSDRRAEHIRSVLRAAVGDRVQVGMVNGQRGEAEVGAVDRSGVVLRRLLLPQPPDVLYPITLQLGHPRPIVLRRILKDAATAGFCRIDIIRSQLGERSYMESSLWQDERQLQELLVLGAEQAGGSRIPELRRFWSLDRCLQKGGTPIRHCGFCCTRGCRDHWICPQRVRQRPQAGASPAAARIAARCWLQSGPSAAGLKVRCSSFCMPAIGR